MKEGRRKGDQSPPPPARHCPGLWQPNSSSSLPFSTKEDITYTVIRRWKEGKGLRAQIPSALLFLLPWLEAFTFLRKKERRRRRLLFITSMAAACLLLLSLGFSFGGEEEKEDKTLGRLFRLTFPVYYFCLPAVKGKGRKVSGEGGKVFSSLFGGSLIVAATLQKDAMFGGGHLERKYNGHPVFRHQK